MNRLTERLHYPETLSGILVRVSTGGDTLRISTTSLHHQKLQCLDYRLNKNCI